VQETRQNSVTTSVVPQGGHFDVVSDGQGTLFLLQAQVDTVFQVLNV
jgi:hypothetical protein